MSGCQGAFLINPTGLRLTKEWGGLCERVCQLSSTFAALSTCVGCKRQQISAVMFSFHPCSLDSF